MQTQAFSFFRYLGDPRARLFFRNSAIEVYYSRVTRKELLHPPISDAEKARVLTLLAGLRLINPDNQIAAAYSDLLSRYGYLRVHLAGALIAASAWVKNLPLVTTNLRHFQQIREIEVIPF
ncbi:MAG TPA: PIN domain-containing protein [Blastocatellia bacterium]|nr:PIN domain-containing protein [Blastocatellia bacterium]